MKATRSILSVLPELGKLPTTMGLEEMTRMMDVLSVLSVIFPFRIPTTCPASSDRRPFSRSNHSE
ncbi:MAG: hypothetical protein HRU40_19010 [Saprospiraceae bacterium]|nr:hypothetical protein [Saprospiraceae bacterium]